MAYATSTQLARETAAILEVIERGEPVIIIKQNRPLAVVVPFNPNDHGGIKLIPLKTEEE